MIAKNFREKQSYYRIYTKKLQEENKLIYQSQDYSTSRQY